MKRVDPRLVAAISEQLRRRPDADEARLVLEAADQRLGPGDRVITGNVVQVEVRPGDRGEADLGPLGRTWVEIR
jgi:hypothetical protein